MLKIRCELPRASRKALVDNILAVGKMAKAAGGEALYDFADQVIMTESAVECPRDTWTLVNSRFVKRPVEFAGGVFVDMGYGGPNDRKNPKNKKMASEYMIIVHEDLLGHNYKVGGPKFLENPVRRNQAMLMSHLGDKVSLAMTNARFK
jgi:hypothetical protein